MARLGDVFPLIRNGASIKQIDGAGGYPITRIETIANREVDRNKFGYADIVDLSKYWNYILQDGDILMSHINSEKHLGKVALYSYQNSERIIHGMNLLMLRASTEKVNAKYAAYFFNADRFLRQIPNITKKSVNQASFTVTALKELEIPLPPLDEQKRIADTLDKVSNLISLRKQQLETLDEMVKARFVEMFGDITDDVTVEYYIEALTAGKSLAGEEECRNKVLKTGAATYDKFDATQVKNLPVDYIPAPEHLLKDNDIIISRMNTAELVGATAYVWKAPKDTYLPDRLWRAELKPNTNALFVWQMLIQPSTKEQIQRVASGTSGSMKNISKAGLLGLRVKKVSLDLQNQFAAFVEQIDKSKLAIQNSLTQLETLKKALMQEYFG